MEGTENDKDAAAFIDATRKRLQQNGSKANRLKLNDDEIKWMETMTQYKDNVIIPNSSGIKLLNQLFPKLKEFTKKNPEYRIKLVGYRMADIRQQSSGELLPIQHIRYSSFSGTAER